MLDIYSGSERFFYPVAGGKWKFGPAGNTKLFKKLVGHEQMVVAMRSPEQCVLRNLIGFDSNAPIPMYSSERTYDDKALMQFRNDVKELEANIKEATEESEYDLVNEYKKQLRRLKKILKKWAKSDLITPYRARPLNDGNPIKPITHRMRQAKRRVVRALKRGGFEDEAADLNDSYKVGDYSVVFYQCNSQFKWILAPLEKSCAKRVP
jgi:hypothetical protein